MFDSLWCSNIVSYYYLIVYNNNNDDDDLWIVID
jgi:hypothetical protein